MSRYSQLDTISQMWFNGRMTRKLDFLGTISIYDRHYFNVYRRYNNVYEIVLEDFAGDLHFHRDYTVRESIQRIMCLSDKDMMSIYTASAMSYKHRAEVSEEVTSLRWTEIEHRWYAMDINLGGIPTEGDGLPSKLTGNTDATYQAAPIIIPLDHPSGKSVQSTIRQLEEVRQHYTKKLTQIEENYNNLFYIVVDLNEVKKSYDNGAHHTIEMLEEWRKAYDDVNARLVHFENLKDQYTKHVNGITRKLNSLNGIPTQESASPTPSNAVQIPHIDVDMDQETYSDESTVSISTPQHDHIQPIPDTPILNRYGIHHEPKATPINLTDRFQQIAADKPADKPAEECMVLRNSKRVYKL